MSSTRPAYIKSVTKISSAKQVRGYYAGNESVTSHLESNVERANRRLEERHGRQQNKHYRPSGPALAEEIFRTGWDSSEEADVYEGEMPDMEFEPDWIWSHQPSLELESTIELQERLQKSIRLFESAHQNMCIAALRWHQLMEDVHQSEQIKKMFLDMQMVRRLSGLDHH